MENSHTAWLFLIHFVVIQDVLMMRNYCSYSTENVFKTEPTDARVYEGEDVSFSCSVLNFNQDTDSITWEVVPQFSHNTEIESFQQNGVRISTITAYAMSRTEHYFRCILQSVDTSVPAGSQYRSVCNLSRRAKTIIQYFPRQSEIDCVPLAHTLYDIGDSLTVTCSVPRGNPSVDVGWLRHAPDVLITRSILREDGALRVASQTMTVTRNLHLKRVTCRATSELLFPDRKIECLTDLIKVNLPLRVYMIPTNVTLDNINDITFSCMAEGFPGDFTYSWSCFPHDMFIGCDSKSRTANISLDCTYYIRVSNVERVNISCSVTSSTGQSSDATELLLTSNVRKTCKTQRLFRDINNTANHLTLKQTNLYYVGVDKWIAELTCNVSPVFRDLDNYHIQWKVNAEIISENSKEYVRKIESPDNFVLLLQNLSWSNNPPRVGCEAVTAFGSLTNEVTVSFGCRECWREKRNKTLMSDQKVPPVSMPNLHNMSHIPGKPKSAVNATMSTYNNNILNDDAKSKIELTAPGIGYITTIVACTVVVLLLIFCTIALISGVVYKFIVKKQKFTERGSKEPYNDHDVDSEDHVYAVPDEIHPFGTAKQIDSAPTQYEEEQVKETIYCYEIYTTTPVSRCSSITDIISYISYAQDHTDALTNEPLTNSLHEYQSVSESEI